MLQQRRNTCSAEVNGSPVAEYDGSECTMAVNGKGSINEIYAVNKTPLIWAADMGNSDCVNKLVAAGADVNKMDDTNGTALSYAAMGGQGRCIKILIEAGADVNMMTGKARIDLSECRRTALMWLLISDFEGRPALEEGDLMCYHMSNNQYSAMIQKSSHGEGFNALLAAGADVNIIDGNGYSALIYALMLKDKPQYTKKLLDAGANVNMVYRPKISPLISALIHQAVKNVDLLLKAGAVVNAENSDFLFTCCDGNWKNVKLLLRAGLRINTNRTIPPEVISEHVKQKNSQIHLKHLCRVRIRNHLLELDPHQNLFVRVPQLGLPKSLVSYLLYDVSMDDLNDDNK